MIATIANAKSQADGSWFFNEFVLPNYREYLTDQLSVRRAFNVAISIAHVPDHIVIRQGGSKGHVGDTRKHFRSRSVPFRQTEAMCNAFKHVHARGGGKRNSVVTSTSDVWAANTDAILFVSPIDGSDQEFRLLEPVLICNIQDNGRSQKLWVGWTLYTALRFASQQVGCERQILSSDQPRLINLARRSM